MNQHSVTVYSLPTCAYCRLTKEYLHERNIPFHEINVEANEAAIEEMVKKSGQLSVPVIDIDGQVIVGYQKKLFDALL